jgi:hypothetical protein
MYTFAQTSCCAAPHVLLCACHHLRYAIHTGLFRSANPHKHGDTSTAKEFENVRKCVRKGCLAQRLPEGEAHKLLRVDKHGMPVYTTVGHTGKNEAMHRGLNHLTEFITAVCERTMALMLALAIYWYNRKRDEDYNLVRKDAPHTWQPALAPGARIQELDCDSDSHELFGFDFKEAQEQRRLQAKYDAYNAIVEQHGASMLEKIPSAGASNHTRCVHEY